MASCVETDENLNCIVEGLKLLKVKEIDERKEVKADLAMLKELFRGEELVDWFAQLSGRSYTTVPLSTYSPEYRDIVQKSQDVPPRFQQRFTVTSVERVLNPYLMAMYLLKKSQLLQDYGSVDEEHLFHGSTEQKISAICDRNFDYRLSGTSRGIRYGKGVSFSPQFFYSNWFADKRTHDRVMLYCRVLKVRSHLGCVGTVVPLEGYDSTHRSDGSVLVKYDDDTFYPEYRIRYRVHGNFRHRLLLF